MNIIKYIVGALVAINMTGCYVSQVESGQVGVEKVWGK